MKNIVIIIIIILITSCVSKTPTSEWAANSAEQNSLIAEHADYLRSKYAGTQKDEAYFALLAIINGEKCCALYNLYLDDNAENKIDNSLVSDIKFTKKVVVSQLDYYSRIWSEAIDKHVRNKYAYVDFQTALDITINEYFRVGVFSKMNSMKENIKFAISKKDKQKFKNTYELYGILSQLIELAKEPKGNLRTFNSTVNSLNNEFSKLLALAELEG